MDQEFSKQSDFHVASVIVPTLPDALSPRVRAQLGKARMSAWRSAPREARKKSKACSSSTNFHSGI